MGVIDNTRVLSKPIAYGLTAFGLLFSAITVFLLIYTNTKPIHYNAFVTYFLLITTVVVMPAVNILATKHSFFKLPAIIGTNLTLMLMLLFFNEVNGPFTPLWSMVILLTTLYYGWPGFITSSLCLPVVTALYVTLFSKELTPSFAVYTGIAVMVNAFAIFSSYLFVRVIMGSRKKNHELLQAQKSEMLQVNRLNTLLNSISDAVMTLNRYGRVTSQNAAAQVFFDTNESLIGQDIDKILSLTDKDGKAVSIRSVIDTVKSSSLRDDLSTGSEGDLRHLSIQMARIRSTFGDSEEYGVVLIMRDITKQKTLEDEKDEFISVTSHELRTPVAIAEGSLSNFLLMQEREMPKEKLVETAEAAYKQIVYLAQMINDLSTLSRAERGIGDDIEPVDANELLHNLFTKYTVQAEEKSLKLNLDTDHQIPDIETSHLYLEEILQNFITNAIKYTKKGSVSFGAKLELDNKVTFFVKDTGIGISKSDLQHIFEKFYRSEDYRTRETSGTGLGLYVVEKLAHKLGTHIDVESRLNVGSTFSFVVPLKSVTRPKAEDEKDPMAEVATESPEKAPAVAETPAVS